MGKRATEFFRLISSGAPRAWAWQARQILLLRERYSTEEIDRALGHASSFGALEHAAVERILAARALPRTLDEYVAEDAARRIEETLGHARTPPRDLTEYDRLPVAGGQQANTEEPPWRNEMTPAASHQETAATAMTTSSEDSVDTLNSLD
jgi:hypothetical protein